MIREHRHMLGAFAAMIFVGASWGANLPVTKVMLSHFDLMPMPPWPRSWAGRRSGST